MTNDAFTHLGLKKAQLHNLQALGYHQMTAIQARAIPAILNKKDIVAKAKTGSGKTVAFGLGLLHHLNPRFFGVQALILCPTRELANQVAQEIRKLARSVANTKVVVLSGGKPFGPQVGSLSHGAHIVVGTPGRVNDHLEKGTLIVTQLTTLVLDEADRMLDMGFITAIKAIIKFTPKTRQTLLFSATYQQNIQTISQQIQRQPQLIEIAEQQQETTIKQLFYEIKTAQRQATLRALLAHYQLRNTIVFCHTKKQCAEVASWLQSQDIAALAMHGDMEQSQREQGLIRFSNRSCLVLVATDVAARGLDIQAVDAVINYTLPTDTSTYIHRIGRTGRAGAAGLALSLLTEADHHRAKAIEAYQQQPNIIDVPASLDCPKDFTLAADMVTIQINAGRKQKLRAGDIVGALIGQAGLKKDDIGMIHIQDMSSYVAIKQGVLRQAMNYLSQGKVKGRTFRVRRIH
ncbi:MAG TPA: ATP-dependent RNA helicase DbpA [Gammaproteobacteria bacterium]|nr:ATP-dependent RNA helicase DbpA [Gammaproteobacteria bacterium]